MNTSKAVIRGMQDLSRSQVGVGKRLGTAKSARIAEKEFDRSIRQLSRIAKDKRGLSDDTIAALLGILIGSFVVSKVEQDLEREFDRIF